MDPGPVGQTCSAPTWPYGNSSHYWYEQDMVNRAGFQG